MADDEKLKTEAEEIIVIETPDGRPPSAAPGDDGDVATDDGGHDDEDHDDERLGSSEDENEDEVTANRRRRKQRREAQRRAREAKDRQIDDLIRANVAMQERLSNVEGHSVQSTLSTLDSSIAKALRDAQQAEAIEAQALNESNGEDAVLARNVRDAARSEAARLQQHKDAILRQSQQPSQQGAANPLRDQWLQANSAWFDPQSGDRYSALARGIDNEIIREGFDPHKPDYWMELTRRTRDAFEALEGQPASGGKQASGGRNAPPLGGRSEHPTPGTRNNTFYLSPERKKAIVEAGAWDDPVARQRYIKSYRDFDTANADAAR